MLQFLSSLAFVLLAQGQDQRALRPWPVDVPANARLYVQLTSDRPGRMAAWRDPDGTLQVVYQHRNAGDCVTDIRSTIAVDAVGAVIWLRHTGQACEPTRSVNETYSRSGSLGRWQNHLGSGEGDVIGKKFFTSATDVPEERAQLVRALLAAGNQLQLLPAGEAHLERVQTLTLSAGNRTETVTHYRVHGLASGPSSVWLDGKGELFALNAELIRQGWEASAAVLGRKSPSESPAISLGPSSRR